MTKSKVQKKWDEFLEVCGKAKADAHSVPMLFFMKRVAGSPTSILRILTDEVYLGKIYYGAEKIVNGKRVKGTDPICVSVPPIWTREQIEEHKAAFYKNKNVMVGRPSEYKYPLLKMIRCDVCGGRYDGSPSHGHRYYRHMLGSKCRGPWMNAQVTENRVRATIEKLLKHPEELRKAANAYEAARGAGVVDIASREAPLKAKITKLEKEEKRLVQAIRYSDEPVETLSTELRQLRADRERVQAELAEVQKQMAVVEPPKDLDALIAQARKGIEKLTDEEWWGTIRDLVDEIRVAADKTITIVGLIAKPEPDSTVWQEAIPRVAGKLTRRPRASKSRMRWRSRAVAASR